MAEQEQINYFAKTNFRNRQVPFGIKTDDRRRHMYVIGKTGMGKTTMMENMAIQDIRNGNGICYIDPHGDSIRKILDYIPNDRVNDVVYFNPADLDFPIAFNILEAVDSKYKHLVASGLMGVFTKIWASMWSSRMEYILNNTILALLDSPGNTMLGIVRMYVDKKYRKKIIDSIKDPMVKAFWLEEFANYAEKYRTEAVAPIQNKVGQFLSSSIIRNIVGQPKSTIDLREIMDGKKILLLDLSKGKVGEDNSALLGAMIITKLQLAALSRVDINEEERKDFYLYVDEFQNFVTDSFATILSEARKYRLNLTMGHQYIGQLIPEGNNKMRDAVFGNVGTMVVFRVGAADAEYLETEFEPHFAPTDIVNIPKYNVILKLMINGIASDPFTAQTLQVDESWFTGNAEKVIKVSRERYANPAAEVEDKINRWMGAEFHEASAESASGTEKARENESRGDEPMSMPQRRVPVQKDEPAEYMVQPARAQQSAQPSQQDRPQEQQRTEPAKPAIKISSAFKDRMQQMQNGPRPQNKKPNRPPQNRKPAGNPIWDTAAQVHDDKNNELASKVEAAFATDTTIPEKPTNAVVPRTEEHIEQHAEHVAQEQQAQNPQQQNDQQGDQQNDSAVLQPGETHRFLS
ncbi:MAG TPA: type IV secretion system DNA-binding domain-containing protein [Patescibacteria group bacterium]|jgi:hypothetical protein|nr:type IV secretion system DNA-binding domain-containing protein [Patescibacteria group bacterium]